MLDKLKKWIRAFKDDILAEEGAIALYNAHIEEFREDFHGNIQDHISTLKLLGFRSDEIDRIVLPAKQERADKVWLLVHDNKSDDKAVPFVSKITKKLEHRDK